jgi:uncharacterized phage protein gp47/JayE
MGEVVTFTRDEHRDRFLKFYKLRAPSADVGPGGEPYIAASAHADAMLVVYSDAKTIGKNTNLVDSSGDDLLRKARGEGIDGKLPATGAEGFVIVAAGATGGFIDEGEQLRDKPTGSIFECAVADTYQSGQLLPIRGVTTGIATNLPANRLLFWLSPPSGINDTATIYQDLSGGHPAESDQELIDRIIDRKKNPPASGNDAAYREAVLTTPGVAVEKVWTYPAIFGPGTTCIVFTVRVNSVFDSRLPNNAQIAAVESNLLVKFPYDDGIFVGSLTAVPTKVQVEITWAKAAKNWVDGATAWPPYVSAGPVKVSVSTSATQFRLLAGASIAAPQAGQTIAFFDGKFRRKKILTVTTIVSGTTWDIVCDTTANASDTTMTPAVNAVASPWSDSLDLLTMPFALYFASLGPGEQVASFVDPGRRQKRQPENPDEQPSVIANRDLAGAPPRSVVSDIVIESPVTPHSTTVGTPGVLSNLLTLGEIAVFAQ